MDKAEPARATTADETEPVRATAADKTSLVRATPANETGPVRATTADETGPVRATAADETSLVRATDVDESGLARATDVDGAGLVRAIEENAAELLMVMGAAGGGEQRDDDRVRWTIGGSPLDYHNAVVAAELSGAEADEVIADSLRLMKAHDVPGCWHVGPTMKPADLGDRLLKAGFTHGGSEPGMAVELAKLITPTNRPSTAVEQIELPAEPSNAAQADNPRTTRDEISADPSSVAGVRGLRTTRSEVSADPSGAAGVGGLRITRVGDDQMLRVWADTLGRGFGEGEKEARWVAEIYRREGYGDPWRHYLGWLDGEPVATTTIFLAAGVAGVYFVMTIPEARRRGIGAAITHAALVDARDSGFEYGVLGSSAAGRSVYAGLGFREYCTIDLYEWSSTS